MTGTTSLLFWRQDGAGIRQGRDVVVGVAELPQDRLGVLAQKGGWRHRAFAASSSLPEAMVSEAPPALKVPWGNMMGWS